MIIKDKNLTILKKRFPDIYREIKAVEISFDYEIVETKTNDKSLIYRMNNKKIDFHSKYNPSREAEKLIKTDFVKDTEVIIIAGFGFGYYIEKAIELFPNVNLIVVDYDLEIFKLALCNRDLTSILSFSKIHLIFSEEHFYLISLLKRFQTNRISLSIHRPSYELNPEFFDGIKKAIRDYVNQKEINLATLNKFSKLWTKNLLGNLIEILRNSGIIELFDKFRDIPAIIVGAGPSLEKNISELKHAKGKAVIICVNTSYRRLVEEGIQPDIVIVVDPQDICKKYFEGITNNQSLLVFEPSVSPSIPKHYDGAKAVINSVFPLFKWLENFTSYKGEIDVGGSVSTAAYGLAYKMGCNPIIFTGLDLAYTDDNIHFKGSYFENIWIYNSNKIETLEKMYIKYFKHYDCISMPGYKGNQVNVDKKFLMFLKWFESQFKHRSETIIDATEGGVNKKNTIKMPLREAIDKYIKPNNFEFVLSKYIFQKETPDLEEVKTSIDEIIKTFERLIPSSEEGKRISIQLYNLVENGSNEKEELNILRKLDELDTNLLQNTSINQVISLSLQKIINVVNDNLDYNLNEKEKSNKKLKTARYSIMLYDEIYSSLNYHLMLFKKTSQRLKNYITTSN